MSNVKIKMSLVQSEGIDAASTNPSKADDSRMEFEFQGKLKKTKDSIYISYAQQEEGQSKKVLLSICDEIISMSQVGAVSSKMVFDENKETDCKYNTMQGSIDLKVKTRVASYKTGKDFVDIFLDYSLMMAGQVLTDNKLTIGAIVDGA